MDVGEGKRGKGAVAADVWSGRSGCGSVFRHMLISISETDSNASPHARPQTLPAFRKIDVALLFSKPLRITTLDNGQDIKIHVTVEQQVPSTLTFPNRDSLQQGPQATVTVGT